jgi:hypothetical protein
MKNNILLIIVIFLFTSCSTRGPINNVGFDSSISLYDLRGSYRNIGDSGGGYVAYYLSEIIWPEDKSLNHKLIETVNVETIDNSTLIIKAFSPNGMLKESTFKQGKDFKYKKGKLIFSRESGAFNNDIGETMLGFYIVNTTFGLDKNGNGKVRYNLKGVGTVYLILPVALRENEDIRFERLK